MTDLRANQMTGEQWVFEPRTADPATTEDGERWLRADLNSGDKIATLRVDVGNSIRDVPIFSTGTAVDTVSEAMRIQVNGVTGYVPIVPVSDAAFPELRMQHNSEIHGYHDRVAPGSAIPDSAVAQYDATQISASDGSTVSTLSDQIGTFDLSGGSPTYQSGGINGNPALDFDGADVLSESNITITQPYTVISLFSHDTIASRHIYSSSSKRAPSMEGSQTGSNLTDMTAGADILGNNTQLSPVIYTGVYDGASSILRENATQTASGDVGSDSFDGLRVGNGPQGYGDGQFGELVVYDAALSSSDISSEEQRIADKFGITL